MTLRPVNLMNEELYSYKAGKYMRTKETTSFARDFAAEISPFLRQ